MSISRRDTRPCVLPHVSGAAKRELHVKHPFKTNEEIPSPRKCCIPYTTYAHCVGIGSPPRQSGSSDEGRRAGANMPINGTSVERGKDSGGGNRACPHHSPQYHKLAAVNCHRCFSSFLANPLTRWILWSMACPEGCWNLHWYVFLSAASIEELNIDTLPRNHPLPKEHYSTTIC